MNKVSRQDFQSILGMLLTQNDVQCLYNYISILLTSTQDFLFLNALTLVQTH